VEDCRAMELHEAIRRRSMVRSFSNEPVAAGVVDRILGAALRSPTAGNTRGTSWVVLEGPAHTAVYFDATTDEAWQTGHPDWSDGLRRAPVVLLAYTSPESYVARYREADKASSGLGTGAEEWPVPYWYGDAAFGVMAALLAAVDAGLGACVLGSFRGEDELADRLGVPDGWRLFCAVALGRPDGRDHRSASLDKSRPIDADRIHRARW
jgi:nitroreductase